MFKRVYLGPVANDDVKALTDINAREFLMLGLLAVAVLYMELSAFHRCHGYLCRELLKHVALSKLN